MANSTIKLANATNPGLSPRLLTHVRDADHASKNLPVSERAIARTYSDEFILPLLINNTQPPVGSSIFASFEYQSLIQSLSYYPIAVSGDFTWLSGTPSAVFVMTSAEPYFIYEDPKFFKTICQGGSDVSGKTYLESSFTLSNPNSEVLSSSYNMLLAKTLIYQLSGMHPDDAYSIGFDSDPEAVVKEFRFYSSTGTPTSGAFYNFDQGDSILAKGYHHNASGEVLKLYHYYANSSGASLPSTSLTGAIKVAQFFDIVDFSLFENQEGSYYGNGYILGDGRNPVEKISICTNGARVATFNTLAFATPLLYGAITKTDSSAAPKIGTNKIIISKGYLSGATLGNEYDSAYSSYMIDTEVNASITYAGNRLAGGCTGFNTELMVIFGGHRGGLGTAEIAPTLVKNGETFKFSNETYVDTFSIGVDVQREYAGCLSIDSNVFVFGGNGRVVKNTAKEMIKVVPRPNAAIFDIGTETSKLVNGTMIAPRRYCRILRSSSDKLSVVGGIGPICDNGNKADGIVGLLEKYSISNDTFALDYAPLNRIAAQCCVQDSTKGWSVGGLTHLDGYSNYDASWNMQLGEIKTNIVQENNFATGTWSIASSVLTNSSARSASVQL